MITGGTSANCIAASIRVSISCTASPRRIAPAIRALPFTVCSLRIRSRASSPSLGLLASPRRFVATDGSSSAASVKNTSSNSASSSSRNRAAAGCSASDSVPDSSSSGFDSFLAAALRSVNIAPTSSTGSVLAVSSGAGFCAAASSSSGTEAAGSIDLERTWIQHLLVERRIDLNQVQRGACVRIAVQRSVRSHD